MSKILLVAEKPKAAWRIAQAIGNPETKTLYGVKYFEIHRKNEMISVAPAVGHLLTLKQKGRGWSYPTFDVEWQPTYKAQKGAKFTKKYYSLLKKLGERADVFVNACDYDGEGSVIGRNVIHFICGKSDENIKRMKFSTLTFSDLKRAFNNLEEYDRGQTEAGLLRHNLDWFWGINTSRALMLAVKTQNRYKVLSIGRVQGPALQILFEREKEIQEFKPEPYWQILLHTKELLAYYKERQIWEKERAEKIYQDCLNKEAVVERIEKSTYKIYPPVPFNLTDLQKEAYRVFKIGPSQTLKIAQSLYLGGLISYPRTSSQKLPPSIGYKKIMESLKKAGYKKEVGLLNLSNLKPREGKKSDPAHPAIFPTSQKPSKLSNPEKRIYDLVVKRFLSCFSTPCVREKLNVIVKIENYEFCSEGHRTLEKGWTEIYKPYVQFKDGEFPTLKEGQVLEVKKLELVEKETQPPKRYTPSSIISELDKRALGTKSTRSQIIDSLYERKYIEGVPIKVTDLGLKIVETLEKYCPEIISEKLTRKFELEMEEVRENKKKVIDVLNEAKKKLVEILSEFKSDGEKIGKGLVGSIDETRRKERIVGECPTCGGNLRVITSKNSGKRFIGCSNYSRGCRTSFPLPQKGLIQTTDLKCKECNSPVVKVIMKGRKPWYLCINPECKVKKKKSK